MFDLNSTIGKYRIGPPLGRGKPDGLYVVNDPEGRTFALRSPVADLEDSGYAITERFFPEADTLRSLIHLNLVPVFDVFVFKGYLCLVMERVVGRTLRDAIEGELDPRAALIIANQILHGMSAAHAGSRTHRTLQPSRILLTQMAGWELAKVADTGIGTIREEAVLEFGNDALTGTVRRNAAAYMAPEQVRGRSVDPRTDLYAIGCIIFEMLVGRPPYLDSDPQNVMSLQVSGRLPKLEDVAPGAKWITPEITALVTKSLAKEREERYQSAAQMIIGVEAAFASIQNVSLG